MIEVKFTTVTEDKNTQERYFVGDVKEFSDERAAELIEAGVAEKVKGKLTTKEEKKFD